MSFSSSKLKALLCLGTYYSRIWSYSNFHIVFQFINKSDCVYLITSRQGLSKDNCSHAKVKSEPSYEDNSKILPKYTSL